MKGEGQAGQAGQAEGVGRQMESPGVLVPLHWHTSEQQQGLEARELSRHLASAPTRVRALYAIHQAAGCCHHNLAALAAGEAMHTHKVFDSLFNDRH